MFIYFTISKCILAYLPYRDPEMMKLVYMKQRALNSSFLSSKKKMIKLVCFETGLLILLSSFIKKNFEMIIYDSFFLFYINISNQSLYIGRFVRTSINSINPHRSTEVLKRCLIKKRRKLLYTNISD